MKKLLFGCILMAALCACEAPGSDPEKEVINIDTTGNSEMSASEGSEEDVTDSGEADLITTPTPAPVKIDKDQDEVGPTATEAPSANGDENVKNGENTVNTITVEPFGGAEIAKGRELFCTASSEKEGRDIAAVYGITFVDYTYGVATFTTSEDPAAVVNRGKANGWVTLEINYISKIQ